MPICANIATTRQNLCSETSDPPAQSLATMSLLAHGGAGIINTWGIAYVGGIIGLFSASLLYVSAKVNRRADAPPNSPTSAIASLGPAVIVVGGVCGVSLGLGIGGLLDSVLTEDADVDAVLTELCDLRSTQPIGLPPALHDDVVHAIDDLEIVSAEPVHRALHDVAAADQSTAQDWSNAIDRLAATLATADAASAWACNGEATTN